MDGECDGTAGGGAVGGRGLRGRETFRPIGLRQPQRHASS